MPGNLDWENDEVGRKEYEDWRKRREDSEWDGSPPPKTNEKHERRRREDQAWDRV